MKKTTLAAAVLGAFLCFQNANAQEREVIAAKEGVTFQEVINNLNKLVGSSEEEDKAHLKLEAEALAKSNDEDMISLSASIYERFFEDSETAEQLRADIATKFPQGKAVRNNTYSAIFRADDIDEVSAQELEAKHDAWVQQFPPSNFEERDRSVYGQAKLEVASKYIKENNQQKAIELVQSLKGTDAYVHGANSIYNNIPAEERDYALISPLIQDAYEVSKAASTSEDAAVKNSTNARFVDGITTTYAEILSKTGNFEKAIELTSALLENSKYASRTALANTNTLADAYLQTGKKQEALNTYEQFIIANGKEDNIVAEAKKLHTEIHGANANFDAYLAGLDEQATAALFAKYEEQMIKEEAPGFTLVNRDGNEVSLADLKGKVVILDFWATWCGPCIVSFPGMQAAVNKYEADPEVEFLFIDTWQREDNYKELVDEFMTKNDYNFHVLFDEMQDQSKSVVSAYGVNGIPTKVVIDKEGFIRFQNAGGESDISKLVKELDTKIALAKRG